MKISINTIANRKASLFYNKRLPQYVPLNNQKGDIFCKSEKRVRSGNIPTPKAVEILSAEKQYNLYSILDDFKSFGMKEYHKLTEEQKLQLRDFYPFPKEDLTNILEMHSTIERKLDRRFPNGFTFVAIGRSPALFAKIFEFKGIDSKICPISNFNLIRNLANKLKPHEVSKYGEYLKEIGISKSTVKKATKPFIFTDYTNSGASLNNFQGLLARDEIGINSGGNARFISLNEQLLDFSQSDLIKKYLRDSEIKDYSPTPHLSLSNMENVREIAQEPQSKEAKLMEFHIIDFLLGNKDFNLTP